jgi:hypothetical protein
VVIEDFVNGAEFYYFVAARDVLGRDGFISPGRLAKICDRLFPDALSGVEVDNDFAFVGGTPEHHLRVTWPQAGNAPGDEEFIQRYWVYRWTNVNELRLRMENPTNNLIAVVEHQSGLATGCRLIVAEVGPGDQPRVIHVQQIRVRRVEDGRQGQEERNQEAAHDGCSQFLNRLWQAAQF